MKPLDAKTLQFYIRDVLKDIHMWSLAAEYLVLGTAAQESGCGKHLEQMNDGPAVGMYQIEPWVYKDMVDIAVPVLERKTGLNKKYFPEDADLLKFDLRLATISCRLQYARFSEALPFPCVTGLGAYWKKYWNTEKGAGTIQEFIDRFPIVIS